MMRTLALVAALACIPAASAQEVRTAKDADLKLKSLKIDVDFREMPVSQFADYIAEVAGVNLVVDTAVRESDVKVTLKVTNVSVKTILSMCLAPHKLAFGWRDGVLRIAKEEEFQKDVKLYMIDVRDLLYPIQDFPGVELNLGDGGLLPSQETPATPTEMPIVDLIKAHTGGKTWEDNPRASINLNNGLLVIKQTPEVYKQVLKVVNDLRRNK